MSEPLAPDVTNDPHCTSWVSSANRADGDFPIQNLPIGVFRRRGSSAAFRGGIAIGDQILDLGTLAATGVMGGDAAAAVNAAARSTLNDLMQLGPQSLSALRCALFEGLLEGSALQPAFQPCLVAQSEAEYSVPAQIGDFTDFYSSIHHATAVGRLFRPDSPLTPNYRWMPIGYHGRSSSIGVSGQSFHRPLGQRLPPGQQQPVVGPSARLDYELELGVFIGNGNPLGCPIPMRRRRIARISGSVCSMIGRPGTSRRGSTNRWAPFWRRTSPRPSRPGSSRCRRWRRFACRSHAVSTIPSRPVISPASRIRQPAAWISASKRFCKPQPCRRAMSRRSGSPAPASDTLTGRWHSWWHTTRSMAAICARVICWAPGPSRDPLPNEAGSLLELSLGGKQPIRVGSTEERMFLEDGDTVIFRAWCAKPGAARIGFGEVRGQVLPAELNSGRHG